MFKQILGKRPRKPSFKSSQNGNDMNNEGIFSSMNMDSAGLGFNNISKFTSAYVKPSTNGVYAPPSVIMMTSNQGNKLGQMVDFSAYEALPSFCDVPTSERQNLFIKKMNMCCLVFDFSDPSKNLKEKDKKRQTLLELVDYISSVNSRFNEVEMHEITKMISANLFRSLPSWNLDNKLPDFYEPEDEEPAMEPSWPHLQIVYEFLLRFVASPKTDLKLAKRYIDHSFILRLLDLFDSEDQREREYLKTILHRIYGKFMGHRSFIRKAISNIFYTFIFETEKHNGIAEFLEILGSIINGFALPLKEEHKVFLVKALIPLHKPKCISMYHQQLSYCITQFVVKDYKLADSVILGLLKYWPMTNSSKEVNFISKLEEVLEVTQAAVFQRCMVPLFHQIAHCLSSSHFQVAERALLLWNNDHIRNLITQNRKVVLPIIFPALHKSTRSHWNQAVQSLTFNVSKIFSEADQPLFDECLFRFREDQFKDKHRRDKLDLAWKRLENVAALKANPTVGSPNLQPNTGS